MARGKISSMQRYKNIYSEEIPKEFVPIRHNQNNLSTKKLHNRTRQKFTIIDFTDNTEKNTKMSKGNIQIAITLSNKNEKKIANVANSLIRNVEPKNRILKYFNI